MNVTIPFSAPAEAPISNSQRSRILEAINPFSEDLSMRARPEACTVVIFGASGDLTGRKLIPALYNIAADGDLPPTLKVVGFARREKSHDSFRAELEAMNRKFSRQGHND